ncbi:MAG TPA: ribosome small subunit-dependent GTPase A [Ignavibacteria bacterium]|nr:ribosome small subunit-dependent GTPase A [Ignavibacteria bacterium]
MTLEELGYSDKIKIDIVLEGFEIGRIIAEHKERYIVRTQKGDLDAEITGNLRFSAESREDFPAVGDWVALTIYDDNFSVIHKIFPRYSVISRRAAGKYGEIQVIAANIDFAFIVQAIDRDFSVNRLERYLTICNQSKVTPVIILTKIDLIDAQRISEILSAVSSRIKNVKIIAISNESFDGFDDVKKVIQKGKTYCFLGSSGVGKSTMINNLSGKNLMRTDEISSAADRGRHITSHRELIVLDSGGILIDNPGMREVGITDAADGLETTFNEIAVLSEKCRFKDCTHTSETGCAVIAAVNAGELDKESYENYLKMEKEKSFFESSALERRQKDKQFGKIMKSYKKNFNKNKF